MPTTHSRTGGGGSSPSWSAGRGRRCPGDVCCKADAESDSLPPLLLKVPAAAGERPPTSISCAVAEEPPEQELAEASHDASKLTAAAAATFPGVLRAPSLSTEWELSETCSRRKMFLRVAVSPWPSFMGRGLGMGLLIWVRSASFRPHSRLRALLLTALLVLTSGLITPCVVVVEAGREAGRQVRGKASWLLSKCRVVVVVVVTRRACRGTGRQARGMAGSSARHLGYSASACLRPCCHRQLVQCSRSRKTLGLLLTGEVCGDRVQLW